MLSGISLSIASVYGTRCGFMSTNPLVVRLVPMGVKKPCTERATFFITASSSTLSMDSESGMSVALVTTFSSSSTVVLPKHD